MKYDLGPLHRDCSLKPLWIVCSSDFRLCERYEGIERQERYHRIEVVYKEHKKSRRRINQDIEHFLTMLCNFSSIPDIDGLVDP